MSRMEIYGVKESGEVEPMYELGNSWLGAALVWTQLGNKYIGKYDSMADLVERERLRREGKNPDEVLGKHDPFGWTRTWKLQDSPRITEVDWCVLVTTFDWCIVPKEQFEHVIHCFREFHKEFPTSHYAKCAEAIERLRDAGYIGYCINATSVNSNPWCVRLPEEEVPEDGDDFRPYNINTDTKHWFFNKETRLKKIEESNGNTG